MGQGMPLVIKSHNVSRLLSSKVYNVKKFLGALLLSLLAITGTASAAVDEYGTTWCSDAFPTFSTKNTLLTDTCFNRTFLQATDSTVGETFDGTLSGSNAVSNHATTPYFFKLCTGGPCSTGKWLLWQIDTLVPLHVGTPVDMGALDTGSIHFGSAQWDYSGNCNDCMYGVYLDTTRAGRKIKSFNPIANTNSDLIDSTTILAALEPTGTIVTAASSTSFTGNQTDPEVADSIWKGMNLTITNANGGCCLNETKAISAYTGSTKTFTTAAFSGTPAVGASYRIEYVGYRGNVSCSIDMLHCAWWESEGQSDRGGGQDTAWTVCDGNKTSGSWVVTCKRFTQAETGSTYTTPGSGVHYLAVTEDGAYAVFSAFVVDHLFVLNLSTHTLVVNGGSTEIQHFVVAGSDRWYQQSEGVTVTPDKIVYRLLSTPAPSPAGNQHTVLTYPPHHSVAAVGTFMDDYINASRPGGSIVTVRTRQDYPLVGTWSNVSGNVYKIAFAPPAGWAEINPTNDGLCYLNGVKLTVVADAAAVNSAGKCASESGFLYLWGPNDEVMDNDADRAITVSSAASTTQFTINVLPTNAIGRLVSFTPSGSCGTSGNDSNAMRRVSAWNSGTGVMSVSSALPSTPSNCTGTLHAHRVQVENGFAYKDEIVEVYPGAGTPRRVIRHLGINATVANAFYENGTINCGRQVCVWEVQHDNRRDVFVVLSPTTFPTGWVPLTHP